MVSLSSGLPDLMAFTLSITLSMNLSAMLSCTNSLVGAVQISPEFRANITAPSMALSKNSSSASMIEGKKILGDLPPNSMVEGMIFSVAYCMINLPVAVDPVKASLLILGEVARARSEEHTSELQSRENLVCRLLLEKKNAE